MGLLLFRRQSDMSTRPKLRNAPITEAVLDISVDLPGNVKLDDLAAMQRDIRDRYPNRRTRKRIEGMVDIQGEGQVKVSTSPVTEDGYVFLSRDGTRLVLPRLGGFSFHQLKTYDTWEALRDEAKEHWERYVEITKPKNVNRIALRYINRMEIPLPIRDFRDYVRIGPDIGAAGVPQGVQNFFMRLEIPYPDGALAIITETIQPPPEDPTASVRLPLILDIDAIRGDKFNPPFTEIWEKFEELRQMKNDIFFSSITPLAEELFQ